MEFLFMSPLLHTMNLLVRMPALTFWNMSEREVQNFVKQVNWMNKNIKDLDIANQLINI